jgi:hypothetical protein
MTAIIYLICIAAIVVALVENFGTLSEQERLESLERWIDKHGGKWFVNQDGELTQMDEHEQKLSQ